MTSPKWSLVYAYFLTLSILLLSFLFAGIYPFGNYCLLKMDLFHAYAPDYLEEIRSLKLDGSVLYSWGGMLGRNLLGAVVTIAASPFNLLMFFFQNQYQVEFFLILTSIKVPFSAVSFSFFTQKRLKCKGWNAIIFSVPYALCSFVTAFHFNIMWIDTVIALPLVFLGIDQLMDQNDARLFCGALIYAIWASYGTAYQLCIFAVFYFLSAVIVRGRCSIKQCFLFASCSLLSAGTCALILLAVVDSFQNSQYFHEAFPTWYLQYSPLRFLVAHFAGGFPSVRFYSDSVPNLYAGIFPVLSLPLFFLSKQIGLREKLSWGFLGAVIVACLLFSIPTFLLHGLHFPAMFPHRYSYLYSFTLLAMAARLFSSEQSLTNKTAILCMAVSAFILIGLFLLYPQYDANSASIMNLLFPGGHYEARALVPGRLSFTALVSNILLVGAYCIVLRVRKSENMITHRLAYLILTLTVCGEALMGTYSGVHYLTTIEHTWYNQDLHNDMQLVTKQLNRENQFYRAEFFRNRSQSDGRVYGYKGLSGFSVSSGGYPKGLQDLLYELGMSSSFNNLVWSEPSPLLSSLFAQKYLLSEGRLNNECVTNFEYLENFGDISLYENPYALPIGFAVPMSALEWTISGTHDPFEEQNGLFFTLTGQKNLFDEIYPNYVQSENLDLDEQGAEGEYGYSLPGYISQAELESGICPRAIFRYTVSQDSFISITADCQSASHVIARVNGKMVNSVSLSWGHASLNVGTAKVGDTLEVILDLNAIPEGSERDLIYEGDIKIHAAQLDMDRFVKGIETLRQEPLCVGEYNSTYLSSEITCKNPSLLWTSIPYDHNWHVTVDGEEVQARQFGGALMAIQLGSGTHKVEFCYRMDILPLGVLVCIASLIILIILCDQMRKKSNLEGHICAFNQLLS